MQGVTVVMCLVIHKMFLEMYVLYACMYVIVMCIVFRKLSLVLRPPLETRITLKSTERWQPLKYKLYYNEQTLSTIGYRKKPAMPQNTYS